MTFCGGVGRSLIFLNEVALVVPAATGTAEGPLGWMVVERLVLRGFGAGAGVGAGGRVGVPCAGEEGTPLAG